MLDSEHHPRLLLGTRAAPFLAPNVNCFCIFFGSARWALADPLLWSATWSRTWWSNVAGFRDRITSKG